MEPELKSFHVSGRAGGWQKSVHGPNNSVPAANSIVVI